MNNVKYYIFRHGETFATKRGSGYGLKIFSAPILEEGKPVIKKIAMYLKDIPSDFNVSSPLKRCRQTTEIITEQTGKGFIFDKRLGEAFLETNKRFISRLKSLLNEIERHNYQTVIICTHGACIAGLISLLTKTEFHRLSMKYPDPGVLTIIDADHLEEINFN